MVVADLTSEDELLNPGLVDWQPDGQKFRLWLQADMPSPEIDFRFTPNSGHSSPMSASDRGPEANFCWKYAESIMVRGHFGGLFLRGVAPAGHCNGSRDGGGSLAVGCPLETDTRKLRGGVTDLQGRWWFGALRCAVFGLGWRKETG